MRSPFQRNLLCIICVSFPLTGLPAWSARHHDGVGASRATAYAAPKTGLSKLLHGSASVTNDAWIRYHQAGTQALDKRLYEHAQQRLNSAWNELRRRGIDDIRVVQTKEALGRAYLGLERYGDAERVLADTIARANKIGDTADGAKARAMQALAETLLARQNLEKAESIAKQAIVQADKPGLSETRTKARAYMNLADSLAARGLDVDAAEAYRKSLSLYESISNADPHDVADAQYRLALLLRAQGHEADAQAMFDRAFATYDSLAQFNKALVNAPRLTVHWEEGSPRARVVPDQDYPLKYIYVDGLRIAATLVRSENVIAVLVSLSNCSRERKELAIGKVSLQQLVPKNKEFRYVHPTELDMTLEAEHVTELTWRRGWLNHIEKTRRIPGYLKNGQLDVDNFFGNNIFGPYGSWQTVAHSETPIVTREQFLYSPYRDTPQNRHADFLSHTPVGTRPTFLDVGDSKTGLLYFGQERFEKALLKIVIGNTVVEIPFDSAGPR